MTPLWLGDRESPRLQAMAPRPGKGDIVGSPWSTRRKTDIVLAVAAAIFVLGNAVYYGLYHEVVRHQIDMGTLRSEEVSSRYLWHVEISRRVELRPTLASIALDELGCGSGLAGKCGVVERENPKFLMPEYTGPHLYGPYHLVNNLLVQKLIRRKGKAGLPTLRRIFQTPDLIVPGNRDAQNTARAILREDYPNEDW